MSSAVHLVEYNNQFFSIFAAVAAVVLRRWFYGGSAAAVVQRRWFYGGRTAAVVLQRCVVIKQFEYLILFIL